MKMKMRKIDLYITHKQYDFLKKEADNKGIPFSEMIRIMIFFYEDNKNGK